MLTKKYEDGLNRAKKFAIRAIKRNDINTMNDTFDEIIKMCIDLKNLQRALEIKKELQSYLRSN
ncbi:MAG: hypothetical protein ACTSPY_07845 [Candidatus Helarchaeota archaeon]